MPAREDGITMKNRQKGKRVSQAAKKESTRKWFGMELPAIDPGRRNTLVITSVMTKAIVALMTVYVFGSFLDFFGHYNCYLAVQNVLQGLWPWANGTTVFYPPLALVPMFVAYAGGSLAGGFLGFVVIMWILMAAFDAGTTLCIYYIGLKMQGERTAFIAAMLYATAFSAAYFAFTTFDALAVFLAAVALLATVYSNKKAGYLAAITGLFVKLWPMLLYPFIWIYNARDSSILREGKERAVWFLLATFVVFGLMLLAGYNQFLGYVDLVYCNTIPYLVSQVLGPAVSFNAVVGVFRALMGGVFIAALYLVYRQPGNLTRMVKMILIVTFTLVFFLQYRSPQYSVWILPFVSLLVAADLWGILVFYWVQALAYIEFPLTFYTLWVNEHYLSAWAPVFFTVLFGSYGLLLWRAIRIPEKT
jgi:hypothetical protein